MSTRQRKTWKNASPQKKKASPPPQIPAVDQTESPDHPAYYPDPEYRKYEKGDTSAWAEDPRPPPYPESPPPAMPGNQTTEMIDHPAEPGGPKGDPNTYAPTTPNKQASALEAAEKKATLCVRIAQVKLGSDASVRDIEEHALSLMDLTDQQIQLTAQTLSLFEEEKAQEKTADMDISARLDSLERKIDAMAGFFGMDDEDMEAMKHRSMDDKAMDMMLEEDYMDPMDADVDVGLMDDDDDFLAALMAQDMDMDGVDQNEPDYGYDGDPPMTTPSVMSTDEEDMKAMMEELMAMEKEEKKDHEGCGDMRAMSEEDMLAAMLKEEMEHEGCGDVMASHAEDVVEPLAKGPGIESGEGGNVNPSPAPVTPEVEGPQTGGNAVKAQLEDPTELGVDLTAGEDPMGLMGGSSLINNDLLALYQDILPRTAKDEDQDEESDEDVDIGASEEEEKKAKSKKAKKKKSDDDEDDDDDDDSDEEVDVEVEEETEEEPEEDDSEDEDKEGGKKGRGKKKKASGPRPQPKKRGKGPRSLGSVPFSKSAANDISELSKIWETAPDVSEVFGIPSSS